MSFQDVVYLSSRVSFPPHFLKILIEVKVSGPPSLKTVVGCKQGHAACKLWLEVSKGMLPVNCGWR